MRNFAMAFRSLFKKGRSNGIKILSLGVGLAAGLVLIAKVHFENSYDSFYPDSERIYRIVSDYTTHDKPTGFNEPYYWIAGGVAVGMKDELPQVEAATRFTPFISRELVFFTDDQSRYVGRPVLADSCLFDVFGWPVLSGNPKEILSRPMYAMVSRNMAKKIGKGNDVVGMTFRLDEYPTKTLTIGGVFEDIPENAYDRYDMIVSLKSLGQFFWDGSQNWLGNERYNAYIKLYPGVDPANLAPDIQRIQNKYIDPAMLKEARVTITYRFKPISTIHSGQPATKRTSLFLSLIAFALIFTAVMNYILIVVSTLVARSKEVAIQKCYGASGRNITGMIVSEAFVHMLLGLALAALLIVTFRGTVEQLLGASFAAVFSVQSLLLLLAVVLAIFIITGFIPAYIYVRIPVASAFRGYSESKRNWKRALLFVQFSAAAFLLTLLIIVGRQYDRMVNDDPGYSYENLLYTKVSGTNKQQQRQAINELQNLSFVENVATCASLPIFTYAGNNVQEIGNPVDLFNFVDISEVDDNYFALMEIPILEGRNFDVQSSDTTQVMVSRAFSDKLTGMLGIEDGLVGKSFYFSQYQVVTIRGIYENIRTGSIEEADTRPSIVVQARWEAEYLLIKLQAITPEHILAVDNILKTAMPDKDIVVIPYKAEMVSAYSDAKKFRDTVLIGGIVTLLISLMGLVGYTQDEISRRSREIAIRKVNGATANDVIRLLSKDVFRMALAAMVVGAAAAYFVARGWMAGFSEKIPLSATYFLAGSFIVLTVVLLFVALKSWRIANENPVNSVKRD